MEKIRAILIDDEPLARENLKMMLDEHCPQVQVEATAGNIREARERIEALKPDLIFLDIRMPSGAEGFDLLDSLPEKNFQVIFVTAFKDFAVKAFNANAVHYILKPIDFEELQLAVKKVLERHGMFKERPETVSQYFKVLDALSQNLRQNKASKRIAINHAKGFKIVEQETITRLEAQGNCTMIYFSDGERYLDTRTLKVYEGLLDEQTFYRVHKSHIINLLQLKEFVNEDGAFVVLKDKTRIPVARKRVVEFSARAREM